MIQFTLDNRCEFTLRTSGTEPKIKYYIEISTPPDDKRLVQSQYRPTCRVYVLVMYCIAGKFRVDSSFALIKKREIKNIEFSVLIW